LEKVFERYLDDAMRIYAVCTDESLSDDDARLFIYIHFKALESGLGIKYFDNPAESDIDALELMLGEKKLDCSSVPEKHADVVLIADEFVSDAKGSVTRLDFKLSNETGMETRLTAELRQRLKLYRDPEFRNEMVSLYAEIIASKMASYDGAAIDTAFTRHRERVEREAGEFERLLN